MPRGFKVYEGSYPHFVTFTVTHWIPIFCKDQYSQVMVDSLNHCIKNRGLNVHGYVIMPNHVHSVLSQNNGDIPGVVRDIKRYTSRQLLDMLKRDGRTTWVNAMENAGKEDSPKLWLPDYHPEQVYSEQFFLQKLEYIHNNPLRAGFVDDPAHWKHSSAAYYYQGNANPVEICPLEW